MEKEDVSLQDSRILIVDDAPSNIQVVAGILSRENYHIAFAVNGKEALDRMTSMDPDLVLLDVMMPEMNGFEVCKAMRSDPGLKDIPVIFLTARVDSGSVVKGLKMGGQDYVLKPFDASELLARVRTHLRLKKATDRLRVMNEELKVANQVKSELVGIVAHDLASPLTIIQGHVQMLLAGISGEISGEAKDPLEIILETCHRMNRLREDTLDLARMQLDKMELKKEKGDLVKLIRTFVSGQQEDARAKDQVIRFQPLGCIELEFDPIRIGQVIQNYVSNAIRYSPGNTEIEVMLVEAGKEVHFVVKDSGRGIDPPELENVFQPFYRTGKRVAGSTGLGLSIVKGIAEAHGGRCWAESEGEGRGSSFFFALPHT